MWNPFKNKKLNEYVHVKTIIHTKEMELTTFYLGVPMTNREVLVTWTFILKKNGHGKRTFEWSCSEKSGKCTDCPIYLTVVYPWLHGDDTIIEGY